MSAIRDVVEKLGESPYGPLLRDPGRRRRAVYDGLAASADPIAREIGEQLRDGRLSPADLLRSPEYRSFLDRGATALRRIDLDALERWADSVGTQAPKRPAGDGRGSARDGRGSARDGRGEDVQPPRE